MKQEARERVCPCCGESMAQWVESDDRYPAWCCSVCDIEVRYGEEANLSKSPNSLLDVEAINTIEALTEERNYAERLGDSHWEDRCTEANRADRAEKRLAEVEGAVQKAITKLQQPARNQEPDAVAVYLQRVLSTSPKGDG